jgi:hypothetical protein
MRNLILATCWLSCVSALADDDGGEEVKLEEVREFAERAASQIEQNVQDYTCVLMRQERVDGRLQGWQVMTAKIRHENRAAGVPFSVYLKFLKPSHVVGREVIYVQGQDLIARRGGTHQPNMTVHLVPTGATAMEGNRYPITEAGFLNLALRLIEVLKQEQGLDHAQLRVFRHAMLDGRSCTNYRLVQAHQVPGASFYMADVTVDNELGLPVFYRACDWPQAPGGEPVVLEQYYYKDIRINVGLTDADFDPRNPDYQFQFHESLADRPALLPSRH